MISQNKTMIILANVANYNSHIKNLVIKKILRLIQSIYFTKKFKVV